MDPSAKEKLATRLFCPMGSFIPVGNDAAKTSTGSESSSQYMRSTKWQASPRIAPPIDRSAIQYDPEIPEKLMRQFSTAGAVRLLSCCFNRRYVVAYRRFKPTVSCFPDSCTAS